MPCWVCPRTGFSPSPEGAAGATLLFREVRRRGMDTAPIERALIWAVPAGVLGARADYVISHPHQFSSLGQMLALWQGGLALFGALIGGLGGGLLVAHRGGVHVFRLLDAAAPGIALAIAVGRVGDLLLLDHLGRPTSSIFSLAYRVPHGAQLATRIRTKPRDRSSRGRVVRRHRPVLRRLHLSPECGLRPDRQPAAVRAAGLPCDADWPAPPRSRSACGRCGTAGSAWRWTSLAASTNARSRG